ncbi:MAG: uroporphyrinogen decarboxylase family protein [Pseudomonadota bacterium]
MDHWARVEAAIAGRPGAGVPVALWRHFPHDDQDPGKLAARTLEWQRAWDFDLVKFMPSGTYGVEDWGAQTVYDGAPNGARSVVRAGLERAEEWPRLARLDPARGVLGAQNQALALAAKELRGSVPILQTVFSPLTTARKLAGEALFAFLRENPAELEKGLRIITDVTTDFSLQAIRAGAHGLFFATQLATTDALRLGEYRRFGIPYDLEIFFELRTKSRINMLHLHGENVMFDLLSGYPVDMINWHDRLTAPTLQDALRKFGGAVVGGVEEREMLVAGPQSAIRAQVRDAIAQSGGTRLIVGPGCVAAIAAPEANIRAVVEEARKA